MVLTSAGVGRGPGSGKWDLGTSIQLLLVLVRLMVEARCKSRPVVVAAYACMHVVHTRVMHVSVLERG